MKNPFRTCLANSATGLLILATAIPALADYSSVVQSYNPSAYWRLNETTPVPAADRATNNGTVGQSANGFYLNGATHPTAGIPGGGSDTAATIQNPTGKSQILVPFQAGLNQGGAFAVEFWAKPATAGSTVCPLSSVDFSAARGWLFYQDLSPGGQWSFRVYRNGANTTITAGAVTAGQWHHVVGVYDGTNSSLYVNGARVAGPTALGFPYTPVTNRNTSLTMGIRSDANFAYNGDMDEVVLYTNALSDAEILAHYNAGVNPATPNYSALVVANNPPGYWRLNEPTFTPGTLPVAANQGYLGTSAQGTYQPGVTDGVTGPGFSGLAGATVSEFNGVAGYVDCGFNVPDLSAPLSRITVMTWAKFSTNRPMDWSTIISCGDTAWELFRDNNDYGVKFRFAGTDVSSPSTRPINDGQWHHVTATYDGAQEKIYIDGTLAASASKTGSSAAESAYPILIAENGRYPGRVFRGNLAEVAVFTNALTASDVWSVYSASWLGPVVLNPAHASPSNTVYEGSTVTLNVTAGGATPLTYQWAKNLTNISTAITSSYQLTSSAVLTDSGTYSVVITNNLGSVTSSFTLAVVSTPPLIFMQPSSVMTFVGSPATFTVVAGGSLPRSYQWMHGTTPVPGGTDATLTLSDIQWSDAGTYACTIINAYGTTNTAPATLTLVGEFASTVLPDMGTRDRHSALGSDGSNLYFTRGTGGGAGFYKTPEGLANTWTTLANVPTPTAWNSDAGLGDLAYFDGALWSLGRANDSVSARGVYHYDIATDTWSPVTPFAPRDGPNHAMAVVSLTNMMGGWAGLGPQAAINRITDWQAGTLGTDLNIAGSFSHPWDACSGPTSVYFMKHDWTFGANPGVLVSVNKTGTQVVTPISGMPFNPGMGCALEYMPGTLFTDTHARLYVLRGGTGTGDGNDGRGWTTAATSNQLAVYDLVTQTWEVHTLTFPVDEASEMCLVNKTLYIVAGSSDAQPLKILYMGPPQRPVVTGQPASQTIYVGQSATFGVSAFGGGPFSYQWRHDGATVTGATRNSLAINNAGFGDIGSYDVVVTNPAGSTNSAAAMLTVLPLPTYANLTNDLVLHLKFEGDYADSSGHTNDAAAFGTPTFVTGQLGQAVQLSSSATEKNYVQVGDPNNLLLFDSTNSFSIGFWLKYTNAFYDLPILGNAGNSTYNPGYVMTEHDGQLAWTLTGFPGGTGQVVADPVGGPLLNDGAWHQMTLVVDRSNQVARTIIDGSLIDARSVDGLGGMITSWYLTIGQDPSGNYGTPGAFAMDDLGVWARALTSPEAAGIYFVGKNQGQSFDTVAPVSLAIRQIPGGVRLIWQAGKLEWADTVNGTWSDVPNAPAPYYQVTPTVGNKFFRVRQ